MVEPIKILGDTREYSGIGINISQIHYTNWKWLTRLDTDNVRGKTLAKN
jgi:hypothetical protein